MIAPEVKKVLRRMIAETLRISPEAYEKVCDEAAKKTDEEVAIATAKWVADRKAKLAKYIEKAQAEIKEL